MKPNKQRTAKQNRAFWKYCTLLGEELTGAGYDMRKTLKPEIEIPWTKESVCDFLFRPIMNSMYQKESTTELTTKEMVKVADTLAGHLSEKLGITVDWPSIESIIMQERTNE